jgi:hypothetical protein
MSSSFWSRLPAWTNVVGSLVRRVGVVQRGRLAAAAGLRQIVPGVRDGFAVYCWLLVLLGMVTAGFVILPLGLLLLCQGLVQDAADRNALGGLALCLVGLFYLVVPLLVIQVAARLIMRRLQRNVERLADRVEGSR